MNDGPDAHDCGCRMPDATNPARLRTEKRQRPIENATWAHKFSIHIALVVADCSCGYLSYAECLVWKSIVWRSIACTTLPSPASRRQPSARSGWMVGRTMSARRCCSTWNSARMSWPVPRQSLRWGAAVAVELTAGVTSPNETSASWRQRRYCGQKAAALLTGILLPQTHLARQWPLPCDVRKKALCSAARGHLRCAAASVEQPTPGQLQSIIVDEFQKCRGFEAQDVSIRPMYAGITAVEAVLCRDVSFTTLASSQLAAGPQQSRPQASMRDQRKVWMRGGITNP